ncbi:MAG: L,D-transpeptidase family protein, partial [Cycloclasticus sp.]|nr:L,D-transpeptidase family protein [Cycloclasticus sp.]MBQ0789638.1 L,D-transpeptidase family protein [Cycloclasticus sp.]
MASLTLHAKNELAQTLNNLVGSTSLSAPFSTQRFYHEVALNRAWDKVALQELIDAIERSDSHGLIHNDYHFAELSNPLINDVERDVLATDAYLTLAGHLLGGKLNPISMEPTWTAKGRERDLVDYLKTHLQPKQIASSLEQLAPQQSSYRLLRERLSYYRNNISQLDEKLSEGPLLKPANKDPRVINLRQRINLIEPIQNPNNSDIYDEQLVLAVKRFQKNNNLEPDAVIGPATLRELNRSPEDRIDQIRVNLERLRWLPENLGQRHILVNIANYQLAANGPDDQSLKFEVIVGRTYRQTPVFTASMSYLVLNPWWEAPAKLAREDLLPKFKKDPNAVNAFGYHVLNNKGEKLDNQLINWHEYSAKKFPFRIRQQPGVLNAMGQVKLMLPNQHDIYLHDTPARELFSKTRRDFSSGCIRVKNPIDLVQWVLSETHAWPREKIDVALNSGKETTISLKNRIPVHLIYLTAIVEDSTDKVRFIDDIYDR